MCNSLYGGSCTGPDINGAKIEPTPLELLVKYVGPTPEQLAHIEKWKKEAAQANMERIIAASFLKIRDFEPGGWPGSPVAFAYDFNGEGFVTREYRRPLAVGADANDLPSPRVLMAPQMHEMFSLNEDQVMLFRVPGDSCEMEIKRTHVWYRVTPGARHYASVKLPEGDWLLLDFNEILEVFQGLSLYTYMPEAQADYAYNYPSQFMALVDRKAYQAWKEESRNNR